MAESVPVIEKCIYRIILSPHGKPCNAMVAEARVVLGPQRSARRQAKAGRETMHWRSLALRMCDEDSSSVTCTSDIKRQCRDIYMARGQRVRSLIVPLSFPVDGSSSVK
jgi:hypothetical protein